jgi:hypothetical protein
MIIENIQYWLCTGVTLQQSMIILCHFSHISRSPPLWTTHLSFVFTGMGSVCMFCLGFQSDVVEQHRLRYLARSCAELLDDRRRLRRMVESYCISRGKEKGGGGVGVGVGVGVLCCVVLCCVVLCELES